MNMRDIEIANAYAKSCVVDLFIGTIWNFGGAWEPAYDGNYLFSNSVYISRIRHSDSIVWKIETMVEVMTGERKRQIFLLGGGI